VIRRSAAANEPMTLFLLFHLLAQAPQPAFKSSTDLAVVHVSVVDKHAGFVSGLPREAFAVFEDGRPQPIAFFANDDTPVSVGLIIDSSQSMLPRREAVIAAGMAFAESSHPDDEMFSLNFNERIWPGLPDGQAFTTRHAELHAALTRTGSRGKTALFDAIDAALTHLDGGTKSRKVLIVVSDGGDNASTKRYEAVLDAALRRDVVIYAVGIYDQYDKDAKPELLRELAAATGGEACFPKKLVEVRPTLERIARDIRSSYTIGYVPPAGRPTSARKIRVDVHPMDGRKLGVRARSTYIKDPPQTRRDDE
jgi:Ca-activated chloride channel homolog